MAGQNGKFFQFRKIPQSSSCKSWENENSARTAQFSAKSVKPGGNSMRASFPKNFVWEFPEKNGGVDEKGR
jgi:hypothetical protein